MELLEEMEYIGDVPKGWKWVKLGDAPLNIIDGDRGKNYPSNNELKNNGYCLFLSTKNVKSDGFCFDECQFITKEKDEALKKGKLKRFDLVFTTRGTIGNVGYFNSKVKYENIRINSGMVIIRPDTRSLNPEFNYYIFKFIGKYINSFVSGSAQPQLPIRDLKEVKIPLPPLPEQKAIAGVLSSIDDKIELLHRQNKTLEEMAMTLFRQWFIEPTKDGLPEGWEEVSLGDSDLSKVIPSGIKKFEGFKTYLATGDVEGTLVKGGIEITYNNRPSRANMQPEKYSVWFAKKEGVRKLLMFDDYSNIDKYILSTGFTGLKTTELSHYYIWCFILHEDFQDIKDSLVSGSVQPDIPNEAVLQIFIQRPSDEVLLSFNEKVKPLFTKIQFNTSQIQILEKLRDTLLPKLMSGEIRVKY